MTDYCDPRTVTGPKHHISNVQVIYDGGPDDWDGDPASASTGTATPGIGPWSARRAGGTHSGSGSRTTSPRSYSDTHRNWHRKPSWMPPIVRWRVIPNGSRQPPSGPGL